jgi:hypothetical protein
MTQQNSLEREQRYDLGVRIQASDFPIAAGSPEKIVTGSCRHFLMQKMYFITESWHRIISGIVAYSTSRTQRIQAFLIWLRRLGAILYTWTHPSIEIRMNGKDTRSTAHFKARSEAGD